MFIDKNGNLYQGDMAPEDREATVQEIAAWKAGVAVSFFTSVIQQRLDDFARTRNYDGILSACSYVTSTSIKFKAEGQDCMNLRDATWSAAYDILAQVQAGARPMPTSIADIELGLPTLVWST